METEPRATISDETISVVEDVGEFYSSLDSTLPYATESRSDVSESQNNVVESTSHVAETKDYVESREEVYRVGWTNYDASELLVVSDSEEGILK